MPEQDKPKSDESPTPASYHIETGGGTVIIGNVEVSGGDFVGRDRIQGERDARAPRTEPTGRPAPLPAPFNEEPPAPLINALRERRFLLVWAGVPFPPDERPPRNPAQTINRWQEAALALPPSPFDFFHGRPWPLAQLPPLPILSLDPSERLESAFRYAGVPLHTVRTRRDLPRPDRHNLFKLGGDLAARAGLFLSWEDVVNAPSDPDKAHLLQEVGNQVEDGAVLIVAPSPTAAFDRLWHSLLASTLQVVTHHYALGPADFAWPTPLRWLGGELDQILSALADLVPPPPLEPAQADPLRRQLAEAQVNLQLIEEREAEYVLSTDVPLGLVKEKRRLRERIADLEAQLAHADARSSQRSL
jgi:hypothetical protein